MFKSAIVRAVRSGLIISSAKASDANEIAAIYAPHVEHGLATFELAPPSAAEIERRVTKVLGAGHPWLVAREPSGEMVGYAYAGFFNPREAYRFTCEDSIYLRRDRLGRGIGADLLSKLILAAEAAGFRQMIAQITSGEGGSVPLHRKLGFVEVGRTRAVGWKHGRWLDVITMQRALGVGDAESPEDSA